LLKKITGLDCDDVIMLATRIQQLDIKTSISCTSLALMLLFHFRQYTISEVTCWIFEIPLSTYADLIWKLIFNLYSHYSKQINFPPLQDRLAQAVKFFSYDVTWVGDGMEQECIMSLDKQKAKQMRSGKKQKYTITKFVGVSVRGKCWYYSRRSIY